VREAKIAVISPEKSVYFFRLLGFKVFCPQNQSEVREKLRTLEEEKVVVCLLHQSFLSETKDIIEELRSKTFPIILIFSSYQDALDALREWVVETTLKITGSHELIRKRQKNEST